MLRLASDENFNEHILRGLGAILPDLDVIRAVEAGQSSQPDDVILEWASRLQRILLTHDRDTMIGIAGERLKNQQDMPGLVVVRTSISIGAAIEELRVRCFCSEQEEWRDKIEYIP